jgi:hypothetical protein
MRPAFVRKQEIKDSKERRLYKRMWYKEDENI